MTNDNQLGHLLFSYVDKVAVCDVHSCVLLQLCRAIKLRHKIAGVTSVLDDTCIEGCGVNRFIVLDHRDCIQ